MVMVISSKLCSRSRQVASLAVTAPPIAAQFDVAAILVAAGSGQRFGGAKQYEDLGGARVLDWSIAAARATCATVVLVVSPDRINDPEPNVDVVVAGGATRSASVRAGLTVLSDATEVVVVHDAARPFATSALFHAVIGAVLDGADAAIPVTPIVDTLRRTNAGLPPVGRDDVVAVQTPQAFRYRALMHAHAAEHDATDDATLVDASGGTVVTVPGAVRNRKITEPDDMLIARAFVATATERPWGSSPEGTRGTS